jgi:D-amino-acid dehydrogenase
MKATMQQQSSAAARRTVQVIGAGVVGTCTALYLQREGYDVTLIDRGGPGEGCTFGNAGNLGLASCVPASLPGLLPNVPRLLLDPDEPLTIRWRRLPQLLPWFWRFIKAGDRAEVERIADARHSLLQSLFDAYEPLLKDAGATDLVKREGILHFFEDAKYFAASEYVIDMRRRRGIRVEIVNGDQARELEPQLSKNVVGGVLLPDVAYTVDPWKMTAMLAKSFVTKGGTLVRETVRGLSPQGDGPVTVTTDRTSRTTDMVVIAAGADSRWMAKQAGVSVPLEAERGYHVQYPNPGFKLRMAVNSRDRHVAITPMEGGIRFTSIAEFAGTTAPSNPRHWAVIEKKAKALFPHLQTEGASRWSGNRPSMPDSKAVIGHAPQHKSVLLAFGHDHTGIAMGAITGRMIAHLAAGRIPNVDLSPFRPDRF